LEDFVLAKELDNMKSETSKLAQIIPRLASGTQPLIIMCKKRWNMDEKWIYKMIQQAFQQYELEGLVSEEDTDALVAKVIEKNQKEQAEWFEAVEDAVYAFVTNQL
jgi:hypothetical protein